MQHGDARTYSVKSSRCSIVNLLFAQHHIYYIYRRSSSWSEPVGIRYRAGLVLLIIFISFLIDQCLRLRFVLKSQHMRDIRSLFLFVPYNNQR